MPWREHAPRFDHPTFLEVAEAAGVINPGTYEVKYALERRGEDPCAGQVLYTAQSRVTGRTVQIVAGYSDSPHLSFEVRDISPQVAPADALPMPKSGGGDDSEMMVAMIKLSEAQLAGISATGGAALEQVMADLASPPPAPTAAQARAVRIQAYKNSVHEAWFRCGAAILVATASIVYATLCCGRLLKAVLGFAPKKT